MTDLEQVNFERENKTSKCFIPKCWYIKPFAHRNTNMNNMQHIPQKLS